MNKPQNRTDLALETVITRPESGVRLKKKHIGGLSVTEIKLEKNNPLGKPAGNYTTLHCTERNEGIEVNALYKTLSDFIPRTGKILVAGLGNANITPDTLGVRAASRIVATAHLAGNEEFHELEMREVYVVETGVLAQTGMESGEQLKYIAEGIKPDMAVIIDSLACSETERLGRTIQITDTGIAPGSGVGNMRREVSKETLGIPVTAIGMPFVIDYKAECGTLMLVPRDIDIVINHYAKVISKALNRALIPGLTEEEIEKLRF